MAKTIFLAELGNPGIDNTTIKLAGLGLPERPVKLLADFNTCEVLALCDVSKTPEGLLVEADVPESLLDAYPAIGIQVLDSEPNEQGGQTITSCKLRCVSLSAKPNADSKIMRLSEQQIKRAPELLDILRDAQQ